MMTRENSKTEKIAWCGQLKAVQPRIRLLRSFNERYHSYQGYVLRIDGTCGDETGEFLIAIGRLHTGSTSIFRRQEVSLH